MSSPEHVQRSRGWLQEQLDTLGGLRNAQSRDPSFKTWRQNSVTVLQRIWPDQPERAERFRRITFSPASSNSDSRQQRELYSRGCTEATNYLRSLLDEVDTVGVPVAREQEDYGSAADGPNAADDFPVVDLPSTGAAPRGPVRASSPEDEIVLDASGARRRESERPNEPSRDSSAPAPPTLRVDVPAHSSPESAASPPLRSPGEPAKAAPPSAAMPAAPAPPSARPAAEIPRMPSAAELPPAPPAAEIVLPPPAAEMPPPPAPSHPRVNEPKSPPVRRLVRGPKSRRPAPRGRLRDMLGLQALEQSKAGKETPSAPEPKTPEVAKRPPASSGVFGSKVTIGPSRRTPPAQIEAEPPAEPAVPAASAPAPPPPAPAPAPIAQAPPPPAPVAPVDPEPEEMELDPETFARATEDFLKNSPVLGLQGRPVQRASDATSFVEPDAVAVATLAVDLTRLGVPEEARSPMREHLMVLARQLEAGKPSWSAMQAAISNAMQHPALARRLVPVLLPWLERAA